jgi:NAD(P)-dependent dehydrogenase (short-subunit alcohol dehydrogenase family)
MAVAKEFAAQGATVFLSGRRLAAISQVAASIHQDGGVAYAAEVDALDEQAVNTSLACSRASQGGVSGIGTLSGGQMLQAIENLIDLFRGIVMCHAQAERAAAFFQVQAFHDAQSIVVAIPGKDIVSAQMFGKFARRMSGDIAGDGWDAPVEAGILCDTVDGRSFDLAQTSKKLSCERSLVVDHGAHGYFEVALTSAVRRKGSAIEVTLFAA